MIISIEYFYWLAGVLLLITAGMIASDRTHPKRWTSSLFWLLFSIVFLMGDRLPPFVIGVGVLVMAVIAAQVGVRAEICITEVPSLILLVCEPSQASGDTQSEP